MVDVRWWSMYPIYFNPENMAVFLDQYGIEYAMYRTLGNPSKLRKQFKTAQDCNVAYLEYIQKYRMNHVNNLSSLIKNNPKKIFCLICYCPTEDVNLCHRFWLRDLLLKYIQ